VFLVLVETALRVRAWVKYGSFGSSNVDGQLVFDQEAGIVVPRPGSESSSRDISYKINSLGFRGEEITRAKPAHTIRIACVGASTTYCTGVSGNDAAWPKQLQDKLCKKYPSVSWEVINAGVPGHRMADGLKNLRHRVLPLQPDLVIYYEANNQLAGDTRRLAEARGLADPSSGARSPTVKLLSEASLLFHLCYMNLTITSAGADDNTKKLQGLPKDLPEGFLKEIGEFHDELKRRTIALVLSTFVVKYRADQDRAVQIKNADVAFYYMPWMSIDDLLAGIDMYNKAIVDYARTHGVPVVEETTSIPADAKHFLDCIHLSDEGCARMADRFLRCLEDNALLSPLMDRDKVASTPDGP